MKRSKHVFLTLLIPAMAAFGCAQQAPTPDVRADQGNVLDCDQPAKPGEPDKVPCSSRHAGSVAHGGGHVGGGAGGGFRTSTGHTSTPSSSVARGGFGGTGAHLSGGS